MPVDLCRRPAGKIISTPPGASSFDLLRWKGVNRAISPTYKHSVVPQSNPFMAVAHDLHHADECDSPVGRPYVRLHQVGTDTNCALKYLYTLQDHKSTVPRKLLFRHC